MKSASSSVASASDNVKEVNGVKVLAHRVDNLERPQMRTLVDQLRNKLGSGVVVLGSASNGNVSLIVGVTKDLTSRIQAGKVIGADRPESRRQRRRPSRPGRSRRKESRSAGLGSSRGVQSRGIATGVDSPVTSVSPVVQALS